MEPALVRPMALYLDSDWCPRASTALEVLLQPVEDRNRWRNAAFVFISTTYPSQARHSVPRRFQFRSRCGRISTFFPSVPLTDRPPIWYSSSVAVRSILKDNEPLLGWTTWMKTRPSSGIRQTRFCSYSRDLPKESNI